MNAPQTQQASMRVVLHGAGGGPECLTLGQVARPQPAAGEVLIRVAYAGVNRPDVGQRMGSYPPPAGASPYIGLEAAGIVEALGEGVTSFKAGDRVCALTNGGAYADYVCAGQGQVLPVPVGLSLLQAAAIPENYFTVYTNVFERGALQKGESLLVHGGSSGIGLTAIQLAKAHGALVYTTVGNASKQAACVAAGADTAINYKTQSFVDEIAGLTNKRGVDVVLDMVGGEYTNQNLQCLAPDGRLVQIAFLQGAKTQLDMLPIMSKRLTFTGSTLRPRTAEKKAAIAQALLTHVWPLLSAGTALPVIHSVFDLAKASEAHRLMESSTHIGKIMLAVDISLDQ